ncbi:unnamed protein product [Leptidea sinapis]|uniref:Uncharacterized protein n=1 Tax=Leptidea sinapis TaxID=189913 RepID=A0A5E4PZF8_9NEOP|nr:unnamed protein product [Leptidea sinapis]
MGGTPATADGNALVIPQVLQENVDGSDHLTSGDLTLTKILALYKAQVRPHMEYCCHLLARTPSLKTGNAPVIPVVLQENVGGGDHLTPGDPYARLSSFSIKKKSSIGFKRMNLILKKRRNHVLQSCGMSFLVRYFPDDMSRQRGIPVIPQVLQENMGNGDHLIPGNPYVPSKKARTPSLKTGNAPVIPLVYARLSSYSKKKKNKRSRKARRIFKILSSRLNKATGNPSDILPIWMCGGPLQCGFQGAIFHVLQSCGINFLVRCFRDDTTWVPSKKARTPSLKAGNSPVIPLVLQEIVDGGDHLTSGEPYARLSSYSKKK